MSPERSRHRRYAAAKVARLLQERHGVTLSRKAVWLLFRRRGVWQQPVSDQRTVQRFEWTQPNDLG